jgi:CheY-like chemotaxis protein
VLRRPFLLDFSQPSLKTHGYSGGNAMYNQSDTYTPSRILICEDEALLAKDLERSLKNLGYEIIGRVSSGEEAVRLVEESHPDLILMDIKLAGEIDGIETAGRIRSRHDIRWSILRLTLKPSCLREPRGRSRMDILPKPVGHLEFEKHHRNGSV